MIKFEQVTDGENAMRDIIAITDDADAELAIMDDAFNEAGAGDMEAYENLKHAAPGEDGLTRFTIPGSEAAEVGDIFDPDGIPLLDYLEELNRKTIEAAQEQADE